MRINAIIGVIDDLETFNLEFHADVVDFDDVSEEITWSKEKYEISIVNKAEYLPSGAAMGIAMLNIDQAKQLYDSLGEFLNVT